MNSRESFVKYADQNGIEIQKIKEESSLVLINILHSSASGS